MKKWKIIKITTMSILCVFIIYTIYLAVMCYKMNISYPSEILGVTINNWIEQFRVELMLRLYILGIPLIIDIILMIVSIKRDNIRSK